MNPDRIENLVTQVLEETRAFRQETNARFDAVDARFDAVDARFDGLDQTVAGVRRDLTLVQTAVLDLAKDLKRVEQRVERVEGKLDQTIAEHGARLDKLERSAAQ